MEDNRCNITDRLSLNDKESSFPNTAYCEISSKFYLNVRKELSARTLTQELFQMSCNVS